MIHWVNTNRKVKDEEVLKLFRPYVREWFIRNFESLTPPQKFAIPLIKKGKNVLITSPTGTGKTLSCFSAIIDDLFKLAEKRKLKNGVYCIYISPLRALDNDIFRNLIKPLREIRDIAKEKFCKDVEEIRIAVRTGDTPSHEKQKMLRKPPHILITTPETISILLGTRKFKENLKEVRWVIIDEIHELADSKRGVHLSLSLERLEYFVGRRVQRIGAGATLEPLEEAAKFLVGCKKGKPRSCWIVDARFIKPLDVKVMVPVKDLVHATAEEINKAMYKVLDEFIEKHTTTLVFTNTRSGAERVHFHLQHIFPTKYLNGSTGVHHSSISRETRFEVEEKLKKGLLKCVICSTSLELGIDIGFIDLVVQIGSPKSVSRLTQRVGRAGHKFYETSKGRILCLDRDDLVECLVMVKKAYSYWLDKFHMPKNCLDVLAQHLLGMAIEKKWSVEEAFEVVRRAYPYKDLDMKTFLKVLEYLSGRMHTLEDHKVYGKIWFDPEDMMFGRRGKYARVIYSLNIGTIPDEVKIKVRDVNGKFVGFIEEGFLERLVPGDVFVLGGKTYEFVKARRNVATVKEVKEKRPTIPSWFSEQLPLAYELALEIGKFRGKMLRMVEKKKKKEVVECLMKEYLADRDVAQNIYEYFLLEQKFLKKLGAKKYPSDNVILVENVITNRDQNIVFHTLYGRRVNDALSRAFAYKLMKKIGKSIGIAVNDNGFVLIIPFEEISSKWIPIKKFKKELVDPKELVKEVTSKDLEKILRRAIENTELIKRKFRHNAVRALMILRNYKGYEISVEKQQMNAERLIKVVKKIKDFPVLEETYREILEDFMDVQHAKEILKKVEKGEYSYEFLPQSHVPSPFAHNLFVISESDVVLMEDRKRLLLELHEKVLKEVGE